jgi:hypothetical protein
MLQGTAVEGSGRLRWWRRLGQAAEVLSSVGEMLDRVGVARGYGGFVPALGSLVSLNTRIPNGAVAPRPGKRNQLGL